MNKYLCVYFCTKVEIKADSHKEALAQMVEMLGIKKKSQPKVMVLLMERNGESIFAS
jgi:hypothetical protein